MTSLSAPQRADAGKAARGLLHFHWTFHRSHAPHADRLRIRRELRGPCRALTVGDEFLLRAAMAVGVWPPLHGICFHDLLPLVATECYPLQAQRAL